MQIICNICGYVYDGEDFNKEADDYVCPLCDAGKEAFEMRDISLEIEVATNEVTDK